MLTEQSIPDVRDFLAADFHEKFFMMKKCGLSVKEGPKEVRCIFAREAEMSPVLIEAMYGVLIEMALKIGDVDDIETKYNGVTEKAGQ